MLTDLEAVTRAERMGVGAAGKYRGFGVVTAGKCGDDGPGAGIMAAE